MLSGLKGQVVAGAPECNPKTITIAVKQPDQTATPPPEITLALEAPIKGKPIADQEVNFKGTASAFTRDPFMLTLNVDKDDAPDFKVDPCTPPVVKKPAPKGKAPVTKKQP
jgi:hypothetical protein